MSNNNPGLKTAKELIRKCCRAFYDKKQTLLLEQIILKEAIRDEELATVVGLTIRDIQRNSARLVDDQIVTIYRRLEQREGGLKPSQRTYYYIDYSHATDVIKWRLWKLSDIVDAKFRNDLDSQGYLCPLCKKRFTTLQADTLLDPYRQGLFCDVCDTEVIDNESDKHIIENKGKMKRLVDQTEVLRDLLKVMDEVVLPKFDVERWILENGPAGAVVENKATSATGKSKVQIQIIGEDQQSELIKREAEADQKRTQNQLPTWTSKTTDTGVSLHNALEPEFIPDAPTLMQEKDVSEDTKNELDTYYAGLEDAEPEPDMFEQVDQPGKRSRDSFEAESAINPVVAEINEEGSDDDFEPVETEEQDPMIKIGDRRVPFSQVDEALQSEMTPEEYTEYWDVYSRLSG